MRAHGRRTECRLAVVHKREGSIVPGKKSAPAGTRLNSDSPTCLAGSRHRFVRRDVHRQARAGRWLHGEGKSVSTEHAGRRSRQFCLSARYSYRNASIGSIRSARITGGNVAAKATSSKVAKTAVSETGSWGFSSGTRNIASGLATK